MVGQDVILLNFVIIIKELKLKKKRYYEERWVLKERDYRSWGETIEYQNAIGYNGPKSGTLTLIW